jgi:CzcA family heavy metal efflux pump
MFDRIIRWSLANRSLVLAGALLVVALGIYTARSAPVDVFPDLTAPVVTVLTEAPGLAAEEVEQQVSYPIEAVASGAAGVRRVRSQSVAGFSLVWVEFDWGVEIYRARQVVAERLNQVAGDLPADIEVPQLGPVTSIMGEIAYLGVRPVADGTLQDAREAADWVIRRQLLAIPGIAQVTTLGGEVRQYRVLADPERLRALGVGLDELREAVGRISRNAGGDRVEAAGLDYLVRFLGRTTALDDIRDAVVTSRGESLVRVRHLADVDTGPAIPVGDGGVNGYPGVVVAIQKQPDADTLALTRAIDERLEAMAGQLPGGLVVEPGLFRQAEFIDTAVANVAAALRDGAIFVVVILFVFLLNLRTTLISALAIPVSLLTAVLAMQALGITINTMTLGGMTIAIGALVDDAIIFVENIYRRLREAATRGESPQHAGQVIYRACVEVSQPVVYSTVIIMLVFAPLFFLGGVEGRLLQPLGIAYVFAIAASLLVALTLTPVLAQYLLPASAAAGSGREPVVARMLQRGYRPLLEWSLRYPRSIVTISLVLVLAALLALTQLGRSFLPEFNEGSLTIEMVTPPGTALRESAALAQQVERRLLARDEVLSVARRTGRAEQAEHTQPPHVSELDVRLADLPQGKAAFLAELRDDLADYRGVAFNIGQPISHRIDHMLTGVRASLAVKIFGPEMGVLRRLGTEVATTMTEIEGIVDLAPEPLQAVPELRLRADRTALARYGLTVADAAEAFETAWRGATVGQIYAGERRLDLVVRLPENIRRPDMIGAVPLRTPAGHIVPLNDLVSIHKERGPGMLLRENGERRWVVSANMAGRDLRGVLGDVQRAVADSVDLPAGYRIEYGGQFEAEAAATRVLLWVSVAVLAGVFLLLQLAFRSAVLAVLVFINVPLALIGGVLAVFAMGGVITIAAMVGFITLFGIAVRNGLILISRCQVLETELPVVEAVRMGALERLVPILMTALTAALALIPLALGLGQPGTEIQAPMAVVILGGLLGSTALNMIVLPALYRLVRS